ncbi:phosphoribosylaminoimidazolecarboxamide formyltransferase [Chitinivibrio alkaliphilus]|nr:phosphoribosylaminoimidazolecarboxamide formyltransferase [Chitinivibrio alkaliphilus]
MELRYGCNPHQKPAAVYTPSGTLPFRILNGSPGYINFCDALNAWQLVRELRQVAHLPAAASFKHVSPAGAAVAGTLSDTEKKALFVDSLELSPLAEAYAKARGADRMSSFGDWIALSDPCDKATAELIKKEVSDGIIAPGYSEEARAILQEKRKGSYNIIEIDPTYEAPEQEKRELFGITLEQKRNTALPDDSWFSHIVTVKKDLPHDIVRDMKLAAIVLKYTQSNSVVYVYKGQVIGIGAGQQSRVHCTRLAGEKADKWFLRQSEQVQSLAFSENMNRAGMNNAIDLYLEKDISPAEMKRWNEQFITPPPVFSEKEKRKILDGISGVVLGSDAFFPFRDNIDRASRSGVSYVIQPGGSVRDDAVIDACNEYDMTMCFTGTRLFHH